MSLSRVAALGIIPLAFGVSAACGSSTVTDQASGTAGAGGTTATTTSTTGTTKTTTTTTGAGGSGGGEGMASNTYPGPFPMPPQVVNGGGPVLASPKIVPVVFTDDTDTTMVAQIEDFVAKVGATAYWAAAVTEYGVGPATGETPVVVVDPAAPSNTITDAEIQTWLAGILNSNDPAWPAADDNTVYALFFPLGVTIMSGTSASCTAFGGYHDNITLDANHGTLNVAYAVVPRCGGDVGAGGAGGAGGANFDGFVGIDAVTGAASHELVEAATDPYPSTNPAYVEVDEAHFYWDRALGGGEVGDMCAQFDGSFTRFSELPYLVQRIWSNKAALAGQEPCVPPLPGEVYFNAAPVLNDTIDVMVDGQTVPELGAKIAIGSSGAIDLDLFSDASTDGPFIVHVDDLEALDTGGAPLLKFAFDKQDPIVACPTGDPPGAVCASGSNGQKLHLIVTAVAAGKHGTASFFVVSQRAGDPNERIWVGMVGQ
jgi:hypothetical protein